MPSAPAMLSKPDVESSDGRYFAASMSRSSRSRTTLAYSVRFSRCSPGGGVNGFAVRSSSFSNEVTIASNSAGLAASSRAAASARRGPCARPAPTSRDPCRRWPDRARPSSGVAPNSALPPSSSRCGRPCSPGSGTLAARRPLSPGRSGAVLARRAAGAVAAPVAPASEAPVGGAPGELPGLVQAESTGRGPAKATSNVAMQPTTSDLNFMYRSA